jgi:dTDP-4-amino-4,6-dideoxygalactose transaminase
MDAVGPGLNMRLGELTAALALRQLEHLEVQLARRAAIHDRYREAFTGLPLRLSGPRANERSAHKDQLVWVDDPAERAPLRDALAAAGIATKPYYDIAIPDLMAFTGRVASADRSRRLAARSFAIPIHARLSDTDVERVIDAAAGFYRNGSR